MPVARRRLVLALSVTLSLPLRALPADMQPSGQFSLPAAHAALTPPMGWNPWNAFRTEVNEEKILSVADKLIATGLARRGYRFINVDDGWWLRRRADGRIDVRTSMFPSAAMADGSTSLRPFVDRLHAAGFKVGLYTDAGRNACSQIWDAHSPNLPAGTQAEREVGSYDFQQQDMRLMFGEWQIDYVKVDACGLADYVPTKASVQSGQYRAFGPYIVRGQPDHSDSNKVEQVYASLKQAIAAVRPDGQYVLSICSWGEARVADWAKQYASAWRTSPDMHPTWRSMLANFDSAASRPLYAGPGHWNDPDMLQIGNGEFDARHPVQARAHMSMWAVISAPLILGTDLMQAPQSVIDIAGHPGVIAINQDAAGNQGVTIVREGDVQVIVKSLSGRGAKAVALINRGATQVNVSVPVARLHLDAHAHVDISDVWTGQRRQAAKQQITATLLPYETVLLTVTGSPDLQHGAYLDDMPAKINVAEGGTLPAGAHWVPAQANAAPSGAPLQIGAKRYDNGLGVMANSRLEVRLDKAFRHFSVTSGAVDQAGPAVSFRVFGDGKLLGESGTRKEAAMDIDVIGVQTLELVVAAKDGVFAATWADARLER